nr:hypothetical protein [Clostridium baratii]
MFFQTIPSAVNFLSFCNFIMAFLVDEPNIPSAPYEPTEYLSAISLF